MKFLKNLLPLAAGFAANSFLPGSGQLVSGLASGLMGGANTKSNARAQQQQYIDALRANRPNQYNPFGGLEWSQDDKGNWTQKVSMNPEDQARLDAFRKIAMGRLEKAGMIDLPTAKMNYDAMGLGSLAAAAGIGQGTTGKRPWADSPYASMGGNMLRELQYVGPSANNPVSAFQQYSWCNTPQQRQTPMMGG